MKNKSKALVALLLVSSGLVSMSSVATADQGSEGATSNLANPSSAPLTLRAGSPQTYAQWQSYASAQRKSAEDGTVESSDEAHLPSGCKIIDYETSPLTEVPPGQTLSIQLDAISEVIRCPSSAFTTPQ